MVSHISWTCSLKPTRSVSPNTGWVAARDNADGEWTLGDLETLIVDLDLGWALFRWCVHDLVCSIVVVCNESLRAGSCWAGDERGYLANPGALQRCGIDSELRGRLQEHSWKGQSQGHLEVITKVKCLKPISITLWGGGLLGKDENLSNKLTILIKY